MTKTKYNPHAEIASAILADLRKGVAPWAKPWQAGSTVEPGMPHNAQSGRAYSGGNIVMLWIEQHSRPDWTVPAYLTYKQAAAVGGTVRKGEKGTRIYYIGKVTVEDNKTGEDKDIMFLKSYTVFNVAQCDDLDENKLKTADQRWPEGVSMVNGHAAEFYDLLGAEIRHGGNRACYIPSLDVIMQPLLDTFKSEDDYHSTCLHEHTHWTGAKPRLDRLTKGRYGSKDYAFEELVAELGSAFLCAELGIKGRLQHAEYIGNWIQLLEDHDRAFMAAASAASKAVEYMREQVNAAAPVDMAA